MIRLVATAALLLSACASMLGVDEERTDAVEQLCHCLGEPDQLPDLYSSMEECRSAVGGRIESAERSVRESWLRAGGETACVDWFYTPPACARGLCGSDEECCAFPDGRWEVRCEEGICECDGERCPRES